VGFALVSSVVPKWCQRSLIPLFTNLLSLRMKGDRRGSNPRPPLAVSSPSIVSRRLSWHQSEASSSHVRTRCQRSNTLPSGSIASRTIRESSTWTSTAWWVDLEQAVHFPLPAG
jgi:hypothetical protein